MKIRENNCDPANESRVELKYCERCGGLWLRTVGVAEVYCAGCGREMAQMPPVSIEKNGVEEARKQRAVRWILEESGVESTGYEDLDLDSTAGVA